MTRCAEEMALQCVNLSPLGELSGADLTMGKSYSIMEESDGWVRIVDDSGEDYLYPVSCFARPGKQP